MTDEIGLGLIVRERVERSVPTKRGKRFGEEGGRQAGARQIARQVDGAGGRPAHVGGRRFQIRPVRAAHEGATPHLALNQRTGDRFGIGAARRVRRDLKRESEVAMRWQTRARRQPTHGDIVGQRLDDLEIFRAVSAVEGGAPDCHQCNNFIEEAQLSMQ